jgi:predicted GNAT family acetyltransferase
VSAPPEWVARLRELVEGVELERLMDPARWQELLGSACSKVIGPAYQGSLEPHRFRPVRDSNVRALEGDVASMLAEFREAVGAEAWLDGGLEKVQGHVAVRRDGSRVVAVSGYRPWTDEVGDPCVLVHPQFQRRGYGSAVVSAIVESALAAGKTVLYQTLEANLGATTIAEKLGYEQFARYLAIRL